MAHKTHNSATSSIKHLLIDQSNARIVVVVSVAVFMVIFSLVASKTLWGQAAYQGRVISAKNDAKKQLEADLSVVKELKPSYEAFVGATKNVINGNALGSGPRDGDNAKITLDALPAKYDYPALVTNLEIIAGEQGVSLGGITGTDDALAQAGNTNNPSPTPVEMPFQLTINGDYTKTQALIGALERSIRPIKVQVIEITGNQSLLTTSITAVTYYQPAKSLNTRTSIVK